MRFILAIGIVAGLLAALYYLAFRPSASLTFDMFYLKAQASMTGPLRFVDEHGSYHYTPVTILFFYPYVWLFDLPTAILAHRLLSALSAIGYGAVLAWFVGQHADLDPIDSALIVGFIALNVYTVAILSLANVGVLFVACLGVGFVLLELGDDAGGAIWAIAALVKVFPAMWGLYLLRAKRYRATAVAIGTGVGPTALGVVLFGVDTHLRYVLGGAGDRVRLSMFAGGASPDNEAVTPIRPLSQLFPTVDPYVWVPVILVVVATTLFVVYYLVPIDRLDDRATLLLATVIGVTIVMPTSQDLDVYLVYAPLVVLLYVERYALVQWIYALGGLIVTFNVGRSQLRTVSRLVGEGFAEAVMVVGEPVLSFASIPLYGLLVLYVGCLMSAWLRGEETGSLDRFRGRLRKPV